MGMIEKRDFYLSDIRNQIRTDLIDLLNGKPHILDKITLNIKDIRQEFYNNKTIMSVAKDLDFDFIKSVDPNANENDFSGFSNLIKKLVVDKKFNANLIEDYNRARRDLDRLKGDINYLNNNIRNFNDDLYDYGEFYKEIATIDNLKTNGLINDKTSEMSLKERINLFKDSFNDNLPNAILFNHNVNKLNNNEDDTKYYEQNEKAYYLHSLNEKFREEKYTGKLGMAEFQAKKDYGDFKYGDINLRQLFEKMFNYELEVGQEFIYRNTLEKMAKLDTLDSLIKNYHGKLPYDPNDEATVKNFDLNKLISSDVSLNGEELAYIKDKMPNRQLFRVLKQMDDNYFYSNENNTIKNRKIFNFIDRKITTNRQFYQDLNSTLVEFSNKFGHKLATPYKHIELRDYKKYNLMESLLNTLKKVKVNNILFNRFGKEQDLTQLNNNAYYKNLDQRLYNKIQKEMIKEGINQNNFNKAVKEYISEEYVNQIYQNDKYKDLNLFIFMNQNNVNKINGFISLYDRFLDERIMNNKTDEFILNGRNYTNQELNNVLSACKFYQHYNGFELSSKLIKDEKSVALFKEVMRDSPEVIKNFEKDLKIVQLIDFKFNEKEKVSLLNQCSKELYTKETLKILKDNGYQFSKKEMKSLNWSRRKIYESALIDQQTKQISPPKEEVTRRRTFGLFG